MLLQKEEIVLFTFKVALEECLNLILKNCFWQPQ